MTGWLWRALFLRHADECKCYAGSCQCWKRYRAGRMPRRVHVVMDDGRSSSSHSGHVHLNIEWTLYLQQEKQVVVRIVTCLPMCFNSLPLEP